jgi:hypothetical protein
MVLVRKSWRVDAKRRNYGDAGKKSTGCRPYFVIFERDAWLVRLDPGSIAALDRMDPGSSPG